MESPLRTNKAPMVCSFTAAAEDERPPPAEQEPDAFRDWANLSELPLAEVLRGLVPCIRSIYAFAGACRPWRRLLRDSAADLVLPRLPPLLLCPGYGVVPFSPLVAARPLENHLPEEPGSTLLSASRGHLILLRRSSRDSLRLVDALTGDELREVPLPSPHFAYHYAALAPSRLLLLFHSKHAFFSTPLGDANPSPRVDWTKHSLPRAASFVRAVLEFRGRVLGITDRAQLLEFHFHLDANPANISAQMLPASGLPTAAAFDRWHFGPQLVAAGNRLLVVLFMLGPILGSVRDVEKVAVYALDHAQMMWEEVENIGPYSLFVDCAGRSAAACVDVDNCGVQENRVYIAAPGCNTWRAFPPGWEAPPGGESNGPLSRQAMSSLPWPSQIWIYPRLFF